MSGPYVSTPPVRLHWMYRDFTLQTTGKTTASSVPSAGGWFLRFCPSQQTQELVFCEGQNVVISTNIHMNRMAGRLEGNAEKYAGGEVEVGVAYIQGTHFCRLSRAMRARP
jgi:hypothetical protein